MINHAIPILVVFILILIGFFIMKKRITAYIVRYEFTIDFNNKFFDMSNNMFSTYRFNGQKYNEVIKDIDKIQQELGQDGVIKEFMDSARAIKIKNYQLFVNIMPEIRFALSDADSFIRRERINQLMGVCEDALKRHLGNLERAIEDEKKGLYNPITCLGEGIRWIVGIPIDILYWIGILDLNTNTKTKANIVFKSISNIIVFIGLISSIFTIILGWDDFLVILKDLKKY